MTIGKNQCKHGQLARSCNICELETELAEKQAKLQDEAEMRDESAELDREKLLASLRHNPVGYVPLDEYERLQRENEELQRQLDDAVDEGLALKAKHSTALESAEPVAWIEPEGKLTFCRNMLVTERTPLYTHPPKQESAEQPVAYINIEERTLEWNGPVEWLTPTTIKLMKIPLYQTPPTATALVEDFRKRAIEVCRKNSWEFGKYIVEEIESLSLIEGEK